MQPTGIQPSQLLMEVMASAKEKIGQEISRSGFSQQLHEQHQLVQNAPLGPSATTILQPLNATSSFSRSCSQPSTAQPSANGTRLSEAVAITNGAIKGTAPASSTTRNLLVSKWKIAQELTFTDSAALEKVLAQYQLAPSVTTAIRNALDEQGQISLQKLSQVLDRVSTSANDAAPEGRAAAEEIQSLLAAVLQQKQLPAQNLKNLAIQSKASYDFGEFRELIRQFVEQAARARVKQSAKSAQSPLPQTAATDTEAAKSAVDPTSLSRAKLPNQTKALTTNLIPSFLRDTRGPFDNPNSDMPATATAVPASDEATRNEILAADGIDGREIPSKSWQSVGQSNTAVDTAGSGDPQSMRDWLSGLAEWPHALQELISEIVPETPREVSPGPAIEIEAGLLSGPSPITGAGNDIARQVDSTLDSVTIDKQSVPLSSASVLASASSTAATAFWAMRSAPAESDLILEAYSVEQTIAARPTVPVVEKIAASITAGFTSSDPGSSGGRDAALGSSSLPAQQDARRPASTLIKPFFPNYVSEASTEYSEGITTDPTEPRMAATATESYGEAAVAEPSISVEPRAVLRDVIRLQATTRMDVANTDAPVTEPVKAQTSAEIPSALNRPQKTISPDVASEESSLLRPATAEQPVKSVPSTPGAGYQSGEASPLDPVEAELSSIRATIGKSNTTQAERTERTAPDAPHASSSKPPLPSIEGQQQTTSITPTKVEDASPTTPGGMVPTLDASSGPPLTATMRGLGLPGKFPSEVTIDSQASTNTADFVATDYGKSFLGDMTPAGATTPASSGEHSLDLSGLPEGYSDEQILRPIVSDARPANMQQEPISGLKPSKGMDSAPPSKTEAVLTPQEAGIAAENLISASSSPSERVSEQATPANASRIASPLIFEGSTSTQTAAGQPVSAKENEAGFQNSIELLAKGAVDSEATASKNAPVSPDVAERTTRHNPLETGTREITAEMKGEKAVPVTQSSEQSPRQGQDQGQDHTPTWFGNDVQMATLSANPTADKATELFSSYTSSLTAELAQRIQELHRQNRHELTLELQPEHLGRLRIRIGTDDNQVSTLISTNSEQVKELLSSSSAALRQELASQGLVLEKLQIDVNTQGTTDEHSFHQQGSGGRRNGASQQGASTAKGLPGPGARRNQIGSANTLINLFV